MSDAALIRHDNREEPRIADEFHRLRCELEKLEFVWVAVPASPAKRTATVKKYGSSHPVTSRSWFDL